MDSGYRIDNEEQHRLVVSAGGPWSSEVRVAEPGGQLRLQLVQHLPGHHQMPGFDCSGLTKAAYVAAGIDLPPAQMQYDARPRLPADVSVLPGDLLFFSTPTGIHHVGISLGGTLMVNAPTFGQPVRVQDYRDFGDYAGASRPAGRVAGSQVF